MSRRTAQVAAGGRNVTKDIWSIHITLDVRIEHTRMFAWFLESVEAILHSNKQRSRDIVSTIKARKMSMSSNGEASRVRPVSGACLVTDSFNLESDHSDVLGTFIKSVQAIMSAYNRRSYGGVVDWIRSGENGPCLVQHGRKTRFECIDSKENCFETFLSRHVLWWGRVI